MSIFAIGRSYTFWDVNKLMWPFCPEIAAFLGKKRPPFK